MTDEQKEIKRLKWELIMVSKLASTDEKHKFLSPFNAAQAEAIRDSVLQNMAEWLEGKKC